jgi:hypothetical protein
MNDEEFYKMLELIGRNNSTTQSSSSVPSTVNTSSDTITTEEIDLPQSDSGGMTPVDSFTNLGDKIQKNSLATLDMFQGWRNDYLNRQRQARLDKEAKRQFNKNYVLSSRDRNLNSMNYMTGIRSSAERRAANRLPFKSALAKLY